MGFASGDHRAAPPSSTGSSESNPEQAVNEPERVATRGGPDPMRLAAIEEFLARTGEYERPRTQKSVLGDVSAQGSDGVASMTIKVPVGGTDTTVERFGAPLRSREGLGGVASSAADEQSAPPAPMATDVGGHSHRGMEAMANTHVALADIPIVPSQRPVPALLSVGVRVPAPGSPNPSLPAGRTTNVALDMSAPEASVSWEQLLSQLEAETKEGRDVGAEWRFRLMLLALGRDAQAQAFSSTIPSDARSLAAALFAVVASVRELFRDPNAPAEAALQHVDELTHALSSHVDPVVSGVALCRRVVTFGVHEAMPAADLVSGKGVQTIVYSEVRRFRSESKADGQFETRLATRLELFSADGKSVWNKEEPEIVDVCRRRRTDFFIAQRVTLPPTLPAGDYVLKVFVEDKLSGRAGEGRLPLTIQAPISVAQGG